MSCMEINSPDSSGMKGIALMVKNIDGPPIRKGILKAGMGLKENSLITELQVAGANLKDEKQGSKERGTDDAVIVQEKVTNGSYADRFKEAANTKMAIELDPMNEELRVREKSYITLLQDTSMDEERFLKQKSKVNWLAAGDANTSFFHMTLKCRNHNSRVEMVRDRNDLMHEGSDVPKAFVNHYEDFLGLNA
ncbi:hypothetical protein QVD17_41526 [Tagetes erecta]|uniref:RNA-directed DNA polymerase, eukaryota, reverse transcriptase zinc-binding domain protein n=1 Tax=Tagetes erecta TaxID=13708 RepID=A0AAD8JMA5_TARER|nr:hypothetical protein QVD17_41526 [Tagetes erecta]